MVDDGFLNMTGYALQPRAAGLAADRAVWDAVRSNVGYAVLDTSALDPQNGNPAVVSGIRPSDATFKPFQLQLGSAGKPTHASGKKWTVTVVGFMTRPLWGGLYVSTRTAMESGVFAAPAAAPASSSAAPAASLGSPLRPLSPTGYYFALNPGVDAGTARLDLGRLLVKYQLEPVVVADQLAQGLSGT